MVYKAVFIATVLFLAVTGAIAVGNIPIGVQAFIGYVLMGWVAGPIIALIAMKLLTG